MSSVDDGMVVREYEGSPKTWDDFVRGHEGSFCHLWGWRAVMSEAAGHRPRYRAAWSGAGDLVGVNPLVEVKTHLFGHFLLSMPFLNYGGPLGSMAARSALAEDARSGPTRCRRAAESRLASASPVRA